MSYIAKNCPAFILHNGLCRVRDALMQYPSCCNSPDCVIKKINGKLQEIYDTAGTGATTYQERLVREIRESLGIEDIKNE